MCKSDIDSDLDKIDFKHNGNKINDLSIFIDVKEEF